MQAQEGHQQGDHGIDASRDRPLVRGQNEIGVCGRLVGRRHAGEVGDLARVGLGRFKPQLDELSDRLTAFRGRPRMFVELFAVAAATQVLRIFVHVLVARALGLHVALAYFFLFVPLLAVLVSLPISLSGMGVREGAGMFLFGMVGLAQGSAVSMQVTTFFVQIAVSLIGLVVFLVRIPSRRRQSQVTRRSIG